MAHKAGQMTSQSTPLGELELELIQPHMAQKPVLRREVGCACVAREVSVERGGMGERGLREMNNGRFKFSLFHFLRKFHIVNYFKGKHCTNHIK